MSGRTGPIPPVVICQNCESKSRYDICPNCKYHNNCYRPSCSLCCLKQKLENIRRVQQLIEREKYDIFGNDIQKLLIFLNGRVKSKYLIMEIIKMLPWADEFSYHAILQLISY